MRQATHQRPGQAASAVQQSQCKYISILERAEQLVVDMKGRLPDEGLKHGILHQLSGKTCNGAECTFIIVFLDHAIFGDLSTGVVTSVDSTGRRSVSIIGGVK